MLKSYFTIAWRNLLRRPLSTTIHILGLATGISACLVIFLVVRHELAHDQFHPNHERIFRVVMNAEMFDGTSFNLSGTPPALYPVLAREASGLEQVAPFYDQVTKVSLPNDQGQPRKSEITSRQAFTQAEFFQIFAYEWLKGSPTTALASPGQVVLTQKQAQLYFGQAEPLGKTILYGDSLLATVTGVVRDLAQPSYFAEYTDFISYSSIGLLSELKMIYNENDWDTATGGNLVFIKLTTGTTPARVEQQLASMRQRAIATGQKIKEKRDTYKLQPLADIHFNPEYDSLFRQAHRPTLYALALVATVLLLVACINFVNLATAQATQRAKEVGIRKTLGSTQGHLMAQFLGEAGLIALAAVGLAAALTGPWLHLFADYLPPRLTYRPFSGENLVFLIGIWLTVSLLAGTYPALVLARFAPALAMKNQVMASGRGGKATVRKGLILAQFAV
ncbi:MAG: ABC transporter permease, partial [Bernardetiaceae bacterium]|nr:ABC transporter permease [Bernardetiaceae bacterium]